ncbi:MAG TPA: TetR/AcrR family transcriptional regulator [Solirubrobacterales bacterium]|nr:TetR/AcrR family transcriptional regulator [Solirubrobacterales bacterium]
MVELPEHLRGEPLGQERVSREVLADHQRERVLASAIPVFAKRGYQATTVDDLLASGKVGVGNFYSLFEGKEACFLAALDRVVADAMAKIEAAGTEQEGWDARTYRGLTALLRFLCQEPLSARLFLVEAQSGGPVAMSRYDSVLDSAVVWLSTGRGAHSDAAELPPSFERAAVWGLAFYLQQCLLEARRHDPAKLLAETAPLLLEPIVGTSRLSRLTRELPAASD